MWLINITACTFTEEGEVQHPTQHTDHFGDETFHAISCIYTDKQQDTHKNIKILIRRRN